MMRFLAYGLRDADTRLGRLTSHSDEDSGIAAVVESSRTLAAADRLLARAWASWTTSRAVALARSAANQWGLSSRESRRLAGGALLLVAVAAHLGLTFWHGAPPGWLWLILPVLVAAIGGVLVLASAPGGAIRSTR